MHICFQTHRQHFIPQHFMLIWNWFGVVSDYKLQHVNDGEFLVCNWSWRKSLESEERWWLWLSPSCLSESESFQGLTHTHTHTHTHDAAAAAFRSSATLEPRRRHFYLLCVYKTVRGGLHVNFLTGMWHLIEPHSVLTTPARGQEVCFLGGDEKYPAYIPFSVKPDQRADWRISFYSLGPLPVFLLSPFLTVSALLDGVWII